MESPPNSNRRRIASTKFSVPSRQPDLVRRGRLLNFLHENADKKLLFIAAAAGYGKTALATDFAHENDAPTAWLRLDESDADLVVMIGNMISALTRQFQNFNSNLPAMATQPGVDAASLAQTLALEIESSIDDFFYLVLDDFHYVEEVQAIIDFFDALIKVLPEQAHLIVVGRTIPALRLTLLATRNQVAGLGEEHLRFNAADVQALAQLRNATPPSAEEAAKIVADSEGWVTGILLTTHLMWQGSVADLVQTRSADSPLYDYLASEILDRQPETLRIFLLESAVLPEMDAESCNGMLGRSDSAALLAMAESRRLFISSVGDETRVYQYHNLFRDFLLAQLRGQQTQRLYELQYQAAKLYEQRDSAEAAVTFYLASGHHHEAARIAQASAETLFTNGRYATLRQWAQQLGEFATDIPNVHLFNAIINTDAGNLGVASEHLLLALQGYEWKGDRPGRIRAELQQSLLAYRRGQFDAALQSALAIKPQAEALGQHYSAALALRYAGLCYFALSDYANAEHALLDAEAILEKSQKWYDLAWALNDLALVLRALGQTARAAQAQQRALGIWRDHESPSPLAHALNNVGWDFHMLGQFESALAQYTEAFNWARKAGNGKMESIILIGQADVYADMGNMRLAAELYRQAMSKAEQLGDWSLATDMCRGMARLDRWSSNFAGALEWIRRAELASGKGHTPTPQANLNAVRGMVLVELGHLDEGTATLGSVVAQMEESGMPADLALAYYYLAYATYKCGEKARAAEWLRKALALVDKIGYDQMLVSETPYTGDMLSALSGQVAGDARLRAFMARVAAANSARQVATVGSAGAEVKADVSREPHLLLQVKTLGAMRVIANDTEISRHAWTSQKPRELFLLLLERAPVLRDDILNTLWADKPTARAVNNLYQTLYRVRRAIGDDVIELADMQISFKNNVQVDYDAREFELAAQSAIRMHKGDLRREASLGYASRLFTGEYLADMSPEWAQDRRRQLNALYVSVLEQHVEELMELARYGEALSQAEKALQFEPFIDALHEKTMLILHKLGRKHALIQHYHRYRDSLMENLGIEVPKHLRELHARLLE